MKKLQQGDYSMKCADDNTDNGKEKNGFILIDNKAIEAITDLEALGVYTYMKMLVEQEITKVVVISDLVCKHFSISENQFLENVRFLNDLGFMMVIKRKD